MSLRCWILDAKSGNVAGEVVVTGGQLASRLGGGDCSFTVSLSHLTLEDGAGMDVAAVKRTLALLDGGRRSVVFTDAQKRIVGGTEWLLMSRDRSTVAGTVAVRGIEWAGYPALRSLNDDFVYTGTDQLVIARALLTGAFLSFNTGMQIAIPSVASGVARALDRRAQTAYFSDALDEIAAPDDGFDWRVDVTPTWNGDELASVSRAVAFGHPVLSRPSPIAFSQGSPGSAEGNAFGITGGDDFARYAQSVYGIGAGSGAKQLKVGLSDPTLTNAGYLNSTKNVDFSSITDLGTLTALTRGELVRAQDLRTPYSAKALLSELAQPPGVGDRVALQAAPTWNYPDGLSETVRVGEVTFELGTNPTASVAAI